MEIRVQNVSMVYPNGKTALKNLNLDLKSPSLIGLLGPNGAGKSTLMKLLVGALLPTAGSIQVDGRPLTRSEKQLKSRLGYLPQDFGLFDELTVAQFLDYMAALKEIRSPKTAVSQAIEAVNLKEKAKSKIRTLSGGQRQRVGIAQALLGDPSFFIFDEPTVGLDPEERIHFRNLFSQTAQNRLVLLSTHIIEDVQSVCDQLVVIHHGRILFAGTPEELILTAQGHVGIFWEQEAFEEEGLHITARVNTSQGIRCRAVAESLPAYAVPEEPSPGGRLPLSDFQGGGLMKSTGLFARELHRLLHSRPAWLALLLTLLSPPGRSVSVQACHCRYHALPVSGQSGPGWGRGRGDLFWPPCRIGTGPGQPQPDGCAGGCGGAAPAHGAGAPDGPAGSRTAGNGGYHAGLAARHLVSGGISL